MSSEILMSGLSFELQKNHKIGLIGRNGCGKTTLLNMIGGSDNEYDGQIELKKNAVLISTAQEHTDIGGSSALDYIINNLPKYAELKNTIDTYPAKMNGKMHLISKYSAALEEFSSLGYFEAAENAQKLLDVYQINPSMASGPLSRLSGGQKRFVELVKIQLSGADIALIDEPTNHMDFVAKKAFIEWLKGSPVCCLIISHDRDVLSNVDKIIEIKDKKAYQYKGGYKQYLAQNTAKSSSQLQNYEIAQKTIANLKKQIEYARAKKPSWSGTADQKNPFKVMEIRLTKKLKEVEAANPKPSFWIDQESADNLSHKVVGSYHKYKAQNIKIKPPQQQEISRELVRLEDLQLGYGSALFQPVSFAMSHGDRLRIVGRNGAGKTTIVKAIVSLCNNKQPESFIAGQVKPGRQLRLAVYEQEVGPQLMEMNLIGAIEYIYGQAGQPVSQQTARRLMGDYLFDPSVDGEKLVANLSGGQKARLQLIRMLAGQPNLLILDEPTNHLDLPSIEELENTLKNYQGALIYISHDSYFAKNVGGSEITLQNAGV